MDTPGLKIICRDSCLVPDNQFDHPLSGRFDEQDAFVIFDDVEVPRGPRVHRRQSARLQHGACRTSWRANIMQQTMIRAQTKLEFAWGIACRMAEAIDVSDPAGPPDAGRDLGFRGADPCRGPSGGGGAYITVTAPGFWTAGRWTLSVCRYRTGFPG